MPHDATPKIRVNINAAIVRGDEILLVKFNDEGGPHYNLPGGRLELGETVLDGLKREVREEAAVDVDVVRLLMCWEYVPELHDVKKTKLNN